MCYIVNHSLSVYTPVKDASKGELVVDKYIKHSNLHFLIIFFLLLLGIRRKIVIITLTYLLS